ncbi:MAG: peptide chain release factor N(5)-glutamine methyltransferase [Tissierellaceae bacterium]|nr:peptide chain release factor N(5)-glutamine methyltransferase [Tissierellaceae bacterium]
MVINEIISKGMTLIKERKYSNPRLESILVLSQLLKVDKSYIYIHGNEEVNQFIENRFFDIMNKRAEGHPLQYLLNVEEFMGLSFYVEEGVLIPRPDTEVLVEFIIDNIDKDKNLNVLDIGVGSGAISLSIAKNCPNTKVYGIDIEDTPIKVSNINKDKLNIENATFYQGDLFEALEKNNVDEKFHIIVSNPPYIKTSDIEELQIEVKNHEPITALDGGVDGLDFYRRITEEAKDYLYTNGMLIYEIGFDQSSEVMGILNKEGFSNISVLKDYQGHDRVVYGFKL